MRLLLALVAPLAFPSGLVAQPAPGVIASPYSQRPSATEAADSLFWAMDPEGALELLEIHLVSAPRDFDARWRAARAAVVLGVMAQGGPASIQWLQVANGHGDQALEQRPDDPEALTWASAAKGRLAISSGGPRERADLAQATWDLTRRLLELDPGHALGHDIRGKLNQEVRRMGTVTRFLARTLMGNGPLRESSWESAERHLNLAIANDSSVVLFYLDLGETYQLQGKDERAKAAYAAGLRLPDRYPPDPVFKAAMRKRLEELGS